MARKRRRKPARPDTNPVCMYLSAIGRKGGSSKSPKKVAASRTTLQQVNSRRAAKRTTNP